MKCIRTRTLKKKYHTSRGNLQLEIILKNVPNERKNKLCSGFSLGLLTYLFMSYDETKVRNRSGQALLGLRPSFTKEMKTMFNLLPIACLF